MFYHMKYHQHIFKTSSDFCLYQSAELVLHLTLCILAVLQQFVNTFR
nr:MAG TPA: hypothetical protein [Caudoviricetes sp.]